ncbi:peptide chain release factor 1 [Rhodotorula diobovata]|uniref:Peptide chain release factor 1 n=1 Tax=Rhodotorula diobovata TaxID=5288 RepID=A0A5C5FKY4_9BASI|nr:peptide chain release factor 1 [Rhodotorula diobovata]
MSWAARSLAPAIRAVPRCCSCARPPPAKAPRRAYSTPPTFDDQVIQAAQKVLHDAQTNLEQGSVEAAKRNRELDGVRRALKDVEDGQELIASLHELAELEPDPDMRALALADVPSALSSLSATRSRLLSVLAPPPPTSSLSALVELKSGVGGSESSLFAAELLRMYQRVAARRGWAASVVEAVGVDGMGTGDAYKEALLEVSGEGAFGYLRREAGVHRVQRVPATESKGRVHTSTVSIIVLPSESGGQQSQVDDSDLYDLKDVKVETMRSRGAGGQHVNRTESAIRLTHVPTGITVSMQDSRSQHENRAKAFRVLRARLLDRALQAEVDARRSLRRTQVRGADRSEKIRTYNFPQGRLTDHRIPMTVSALEEAMEGGEVLDVINRELEEREERERVEDILAGLGP